MIQSKPTAQTRVSHLVSNALQLLIEKLNKQISYKNDMIEALKDQLYIDDMDKINHEFRHIDKAIV